MSELRNEIEELIKSIDQTITQFYQQHTQEGYSKLNDTLTKLMKVLGAVENYKIEHNCENIDINSMNQVLNQALNALEEKDTILFSDILQFEFKSMLMIVGNTL